MIKKKILKLYQAERREILTSRTGTKDLNMEIWVSTLEPLLIWEKALAVRCHLSMVIIVAL